MLEANCVENKYKHGTDDVFRATLVQYRHALLQKEGFSSILPRAGPHPISACKLSPILTDKP